MPSRPPGPLQSLEVASGNAWLSVSGGESRQMSVRGDFAGLCKKLELDVSIKARCRQGVHDVGQRNCAVSRRQPFVIGCWLALAICDAHNENLLQEVGKHSQKIRLIPEVPEIERQAN